MAASLKDIARMAGVSAGAVSNILNRGREHLYAPATRKRVAECAQRLGYLPNRAAQAMRSGKTRVIGFVAPNTAPDGTLFNDTVYPFIVGLNRQLSKSGYHVAMVDLEESVQEGQPWMPEDRFFDGLVVQYSLSDRAARFATDLGVPMLWWDSGIFEPRGCIYRDEKEVGRRLTRKLIEMGHRHIGYMVWGQAWKAYCSGAATHYSYVHRFESYQAEMQNRGLKPTTILGDQAESFARQLAKHRITALITDDPIWATIVQAAQLLGWRIPQDLSIATVDREARFPWRGLHLGGMLYDRVDAGQQAGKMILTALNEGMEAVPSVRIIPEFDPGNSLAPPRKSKQPT